MAEGAHEAADVQDAIESTMAASELETLVLSRGVIGCPHEEHIDFPEGEDCPGVPLLGRFAG